MSFRITPYTIDQVFDEFHPESMAPQPSCPIVVYLFTQAAAPDTDDATENNTPIRELPLEPHTQELEEYSETLDELESLGWIERTTDTINLTPTGVSIAGPLYSQIERDKNKQTD